MRSTNLAKFRKDFSHKNFQKYLLNQFFVPKITFFLIYEKSCVEVLKVVSNATKITICLVQLNFIPELIPPVNFPL